MISSTSDNIAVSVTNEKLDAAIIKVTESKNLTKHAIAKEIQKSFPTVSKPRVYRRVDYLYNHNRINRNAGVVECPNCGTWVKELSNATPETYYSEPANKTELDLDSGPKQRNLAFLLTSCHVGGMSKVGKHDCTPAPGFSRHEVTSSEFRFGGKFPHIKFSEVEAQEIIEDLIDRGILTTDFSRGELRYVLQKELREVIRQCVIILGRNIELIELRWLKKIRPSPEELEWYKSIYGPNAEPRKADYWDKLKIRKRRIGIEKLDSDISRLSREIEAELETLRSCIRGSDKHKQYVYVLIDFIYPRFLVKKTMLSTVLKTILVSVIHIGCGDRHVIGYDSSY